MEIERRAYVAPTPTSLRQMGKMLEEHPTMSEKFRGTVQGMDGSMTLLFIDERMMPDMRTFADGTFKVKL